MQYSKTIDPSNSHPNIYDVTKVSGCSIIK